ncbi:hypothetical protein [Streptomyces mayteni]
MTAGEPGSGGDRTVDDVVLSEDLVNGDALGLNQVLMSVEVSDGPAGGVAVLGEELVRGSGGHGSPMGYIDYSMSYAT